MNVLERLRNVLASGDWPLAQISRETLADAVAELEAQDREIETLHDEAVQLTVANQQVRRQRDELAAAVAELTTILGGSKEAWLRCVAAVEATAKTQREEDDDA